MHKKVMILGIPVFIITSALFLHSPKPLISAENFIDQRINFPDTNQSVPYLSKGGSGRGRGGGRGGKRGKRQGYSSNRPPRQKHQIGFQMKYMDSNADLYNDIFSGNFFLLNGFFHISIDKMLFGGSLTGGAYMNNLNMHGGIIYGGMNLGLSFGNRFINLKLYSLLGAGYSRITEYEDNVEKIISKAFFALEPEALLSFSITPTTNLFGTMSYLYTENEEHINVGGFSGSFGISFKLGNFHKERGRRK